MLLHIVKRYFCCYKTKKIIVLNLKQQQIKQILPPKTCIDIIDYV